MLRKTKTDGQVLLSFSMLLSLTFTSLLMILVSHLKTILGHRRFFRFTLLQTIAIQTLLFLSCWQNPPSMSHNSLKLQSTSFNHFQNVSAVVSKSAIPAYPILQVDKVMSQHHLFSIIIDYHVDKHGLHFRSKAMSHFST